LKVKKEGQTESERATKKDISLYPRSLAEDSPSIFHPPKTRMKGEKRSDVIMMDVTVAFWVWGLSE
jgi:hypothetical protein